MDYRLPGSSVRGIFQARILEGVAILFSRGSSRPRDLIQVSCITDRFVTVWTTKGQPQPEGIQLGWWRGWRVLREHLGRLCGERGSEAWAASPRRWTWGWEQEGRHFQQWKLPPIKAFKVSGAAGVSGEEGLSRDQGQSEGTSRDPEGCRSQTGADCG